MIDYLDFFKYEGINTESDFGDIEVSIWCVTYNHSKYIERALQGFLNQKTNFNYEVVIFDDASTDGTRDIIKRYADENPNKIRAYLARRNTYDVPNARRIRYSFRRSVLKGKYIAPCEGDDYWIYSNKLQRQFDIMEADNSISMCYHNAIRYSDNEVVPQIIDMDTQFVDDDEVFYRRNGMPPTASFFYRAQYEEEVGKTKSFFECSVGDDPLRYWLNFRGRILYIDKCWSVRNYMHEGSWNKKMVDDKEFSREYREKYFRYYTLFDSDTNGKYHDYIKKRMKDICEWDYYAMCKSDSLLDCLEKVKGEIDRFGTDSRPFFMKRVILDANNYGDYFGAVSALSFGKKVYIYGAGAEAIKMATKLMELSIIFEGFIVSKMDSNPKELLGKPVNEVSDKYLCDGSVMFVLGLNYTNKEQVISSLEAYDVLLI